MTYRGPQAFLKAVAELSKLPGIGERTAQRLVFHLIHAERSDAEALAAAEQASFTFMKLSLTFSYLALSPASPRLTPRACSS